MAYKKTELKLLAALAMLIQSNKIEDITVNDIIAEAKISRRTFYNYYNSKESFFQEAIFIILDEITKILNKDPLLEYDVLLKALCFLYDNRKIVIAFTNCFPNINEIIEEYMKEVIVNSDLSQLENEMRDAYGVPINFALDIYITTIKSIILTWIKNEFQQSPKEIADFITLSVKI